MRTPAAGMKKKLAVISMATKRNELKSLTVSLGDREK
jgi:hypothetical protein